MRRVSVVMGTFALAGAFAGCGGGNEGAGGTAGQEPATGQPRGDIIAGNQAFIGGTDPTCGSCHTLQDAGTTSTVASNLDETKPTFDQVVAALNLGPGSMPSYADMSQAVKDNLAAYIEYATNQSG